MQIEVFALCDAAQDYFGKLCVLGTFDRVQAPQYPIVFPACAIASRIRFDRTEEGLHRLDINIVDPDGKSIAPSLNGELTVKLGPGLDSLAANFVVNIANFKIDQPGKILVDLVIDGTVQRSLPLVATIASGPGPRPAQG